MKNKQGITIAALIIAIVGLSIGFAAFSNTLTISSSATVTPSDENFIVQFSKYSDSDATGELNPITPTALTSDYGENGLIPDSNKKALQNLHATFTAPGQSVTYELYVRNTGAYVAYLKELAFANATNATNGETYKHCYAATTDSNNEPISSENQATASLVTQACNGIDISVSIGTASNITPSSASKSLGNQSLSANGGYVQATITISYDSNAAYVDGPMEVEFGTISFTASSNQGSNQGSQEQGGQDEPQSQIETLMPDASELASISPAEQGGMGDNYHVAFLENEDVKFGVFYEVMSGRYNYIIIMGPETQYYWACDSDSAAFMASGAGIDNVQPYTWYDMSTKQVYNGPAPVSASTFDGGTINNLTYLNRILATFSNNN